MKDSNEIKQNQLFQKWFCPTRFGIQARTDCMRSARGGCYALPSRINLNDLKEMNVSLWKHSVFHLEIRFEPGLKEAAETKLKIISGNYLKRWRHAQGWEDFFLKKALCAKITRRRWVSNWRFLNARVMRQRRVAESRRSSDREAERGGSRALSGLDNDIKWTRRHMCAREGHLKKTNPNSCSCLCQHGHAAL